VPPNEATPAYSPPEAQQPPAHQQQVVVPEPAAAAAFTLLPPASPSDPTPVGLPPIPAATPRLPADLPTPLSAFRIPSWSTVSSHANPTARHYHSVASRRAASLAAGLKRMVLERIEEEDRHRAGSAPARNRRPLEDPFLVGEVAARRAREGRLAREDNGLAREDRRWDLFLGSFARPSNLPSRYMRPMRPVGGGLGR